MTIRWQDWMTVLLGAWLLASPWQLDFALNHAAMGNACGVGVVLIVFNLMAVARLLEQGQEIFNILTGAWLVLSPYALDFAGERGPTINAVVVGSCVNCLAVWQIIDAVRKSKK